MFVFCIYIFLNVEHPNITDLVTSSGDEAIEGENVDISCSAFGIPIPSIMWKKDGVTLSSGRGTTISYSSNSTNSVVSIANVTSSAGGSYTCRATSRIGEDNSTVVLIIVGMSSHQYHRTGYFCS